MTERRFRSRVDWWIGLLLGVVILADIALIAKLGLSAGDPGTIGTVLVLIAVFVLLLLLTLRTYYSVDQTTLRIVSGPFRWRIPLDEIHSVTPSRNLWSAPALSLDRLSIEYGAGRRVLVSPAEKQAFLVAIGQSHG